ncbi:NADH-quinone oxidoreductase subunit B [Striga asiatica]|uniref:NADH-quinone oxidoreductase subunit B n=1 Tax=Striga asiatica TaxID=4170 RepID=A0A5A7P9Z1_STRAF|nr:NADH-quinone oxidoreductase subunit B [Striga asiatica]
MAFHMVWLNLIVLDVSGSFPKGGVDILTDHPCAVSSGANFAYPKRRPCCCLRAIVLSPKLYDRAVSSGVNAFTDPMHRPCFLRGLDPTIIGVRSNNGAPRVGIFQHSNPKLGEQMLYFILSSLRGPVVQGIISELESQGALPRSNSSVSSLATCCGPRFIELLWQLSLHALREVHRRTFAADVASNPLPAPLTDVAFSHAVTLLPVTKARIALERRRFLKNAETAVQRQAMWSDLAHEMTAEFRGRYLTMVPFEHNADICSAYLQQELEKLHELRNKVKLEVKLEGELWDELVSSSSQNSHIVQRATPVMKVRSSSPAQAQSNGRALHE